MSLTPQLLIETSTQVLKRLVSQVALDLVKPTVLIITLPKPVACGVLYSVVFIISQFHIDFYRSSLLIISGGEAFLCSGSLTRLRALMAQD